MVSYDDSVDLVLRCQEGDRQGLEGLARMVRGRLWGYLCRITGDEDLAGEILQEVLLVVMQKIKQLRRPDRFWPWVVAIARSKVRDHYRRSYTRAQAENEFELRSRQRAELGGGFQNQIEKREALRRIYLLKQKLGDVYAEILELRCFGSKSYPEIAAIMGGSCQNACVRFHRARKLLCERFSTRAENIFS